jgi:hypothetical protein
MLMRLSFRPKDYFIVLASVFLSLAGFVFFILGLIVAHSW